MPEANTQEHAEKLHSEIASLKRDLQTFRQFMESAPDAMVIVNQQGEIVYVNAQTRSLFGYEPAELIGKTVETLVPERFQAKHVIHRSEYATHPRFRAMGAGLDLYARKKDGTEIPVEISLSPIQTSDGILFGSTIRDETERKKIEQKNQRLNETLEGKVKERTAELEKTYEALRMAQAQFYQAQKMESLGTLAGGLAHEFGNFLAVIALHADLLKSKIQNDEDLEKIRETSMKADELTRQVLLFSRRQTVTFSRIDLNEVVSNIARLLLGAIGEKYNLSLQLSPGLPKINGHPAQVQQILMNLILNARDSMPDGGPIIVATENVSIKEKDCQNQRDACPGEFIRLSVKDNGIGMDEQTIAQIFDPFFTTKDPEKGTGLGLSVVYGIVKGHQGWIEVKSAPGKGSMFQVHLPGISTNRSGPTDSQHPFVSIKSD